ncbi:MAG: hypothetical protein Satyrvirus11_1, partial [Satyrvirus sp.]
MNEYFQLNNCTYNGNKIICNRIGASDLTHQLDDFNCDIHGNENFSWSRCNGITWTRTKIHENLFVFNIDKK